MSKPQLSREEHEYPVSKATKGREKKEEFADRARVGQVLSEVLTSPYNPLHPTAELIANALHTEDWVLSWDAVDENEDRLNHEFSRGTLRIVALEHIWG